MTVRLSMRLNSRATTNLFLYYEDQTKCSWKTYSVFSGAQGHINKPGDTALPNLGPLPKGDYYVVDRPTGGKMDWIRQNVTDFDGRLDWFALFRKDGNINDYTVVRGVRRGNFRMHPGSRSAGCVTFVRKRDFDEARTIILAHGTVQNVPGTSVSYYAMLKVD